MHILDNNLKFKKMKIYLNTTTIDEEQVTVEYDTLLGFEQQSELAKQFIIDFCNNNKLINQVKEQAGVHGRVVKQSYQINDNLVIDINYNYQYPANHAKNGILKSTNYSIGGTE